ncbi:nucleotidyltransferase family protein [Streptococcus suis]
MVYTIEEIKEKVQPIAEKYHLSKVYLFGSYARNEADEESDIDLMVSTAGPVAQGFGFFGLYDEFEDVFGKEVDLISQDSISNATNLSALEVYASILEEGILLYENREVGSGQAVYSADA